MSQKAFVKIDAIREHQQPSAAVFEWKVKSEAFLFRGDVLCVARLKNNKVVEVFCPQDCKVSKVLATVGKQVGPDDNIIELEVCEHEMVYSNLCVVCGRDMSRKNPRRLSEDKSEPAGRHSLDFYDGGHVLFGQEDNAAGGKINVNERVASNLMKSEFERLSKEEKLILVLDVDHTLLHATASPKAVEDFYVKKAQAEGKPENQIFPPDINVPGMIHELDDGVMHFALQAGPLPHMVHHYFVHLRPRVREFIEKMHEKFQLFIYTKGTRQYADQVAFVLDPEKKYFSDRIVSRDECPDINMKSLQRLFPFDDSMVLIVDDRPDVWRYAPNCISIDPYTYFKNYEEAHNAPGQLMAPPPSGDTPDHLEVVWEVLEKIHIQYYGNIKQGLTPDVKQLADSMRKNILRGASVVFTGVFPKFMPGHDYTQTPLGFLLSQTGLQVLAEDDRKAQMVAARPTAKVHDALKLRRSVVHVQWLIECLRSFKTVSRGPFYYSEKTGDAPEGLKPPGDDQVNIVNQFNALRSPTKAQPLVPSPRSQIEPQAEASNEDDTNKGKKRTASVTFAPEVDEEAKRRKEAKKESDRALLEGLLDDDEIDSLESGDDDDCEEDDDVDGDSGTEGNGSGARASENMSAGVGTAGPDEGRDEEEQEEDGPGDDPTDEDGEEKDYEEKSEEDAEDLDDDMLDNLDQFEEDGDDDEENEFGDYDD